MLNFALKNRSDFGVRSDWMFKRFIENITTFFCMQIY